MQNYEINPLLTESGIRSLLKTGNMSTISSLTGISYDTLRGYSSGRTKIEKMPLNMVQKLTAYSQNSMDIFDTPRNIILEDSLYETIVAKFRPNGYSPILELYRASMAFEYRLSNPDETDPQYFLIDMDTLLITEVKWDIDIMTIASISLSRGIRLIFKQSSLLTFPDATIRKVIMASAQVTITPYLIELAGHDTIANTMDNIEDNVRLNNYMSPEELRNSEMTYDNERQLTSAIILDQRAQQKNDMTQHLLSLLYTYIQDNEHRNIEMRDEIIEMRDEIYRCMVHPVHNVEDALKDAMLVPDQLWTALQSVVPIVFNSEQRTSAQNTLINQLT